MKKRKVKKKEYKAIYDIDIENSVLNRYTKDRVSEVYLVGYRKIKIEELYNFIDTHKREEYDINDSDFLKSFLGEYQFFRTMRELIVFLNEEAKDGNIIVYAHNLDFELDYILRETNASTIITDDRNYSSVFRSNNSPIKVILRQEGDNVEFENLDKIEFRCSLALTGYSIGTLGKMLKYNKIQGYNYEKIRRATDELKQEDYEYNDTDIVISGMSVIQIALRRREHIDEMPMTTTSEMNANKQKFIEENYGEKYLNNLRTKRKQQLDVIDYLFYQTVMETRQGGLTALNEDCVNIPIYNVFSTDIVSSYPSVMCGEYFARYDEKSYNNDGSTEEKIFDGTILFKKHLEGGKTKRPETVKGWFAWLSLINVRPRKVNGRDFPLLPISVNKCEEDRNKMFKNNECSISNFFNGKVIEADRIHYKCNDVDYEGLKLAYEFEVEYCFNLRISKRAERLSAGEINFMYSLFREKQILKEFKEERIAEYMHTKSNLNANYGRKQMETIRDVPYIDNGDIKTRTKEEILENVLGQGLLDDLNKNSLSIDISSDGCYISSKGKYNLLYTTNFLLEKEAEINNSLESNFEVIVVYSDTDSLKITVKDKEEDENGRKKSCFSNHPKTTEKDKQKNTKKKILFTNILLQELEKINRKIIENNKENYRFKIDYIEKFNLDINDKNISEILHLGTWDIENKKNPNYNENTKDEEYNYIPIDWFKSLGAKKYAYRYGDKINTTISGCNAKMGEKIKKYCDENNLDYQETLNVIFNPYTVFDKSVSGRTVAYDEKRSAEELRNIIIDGIPLVGNGGKMIENTSYTLGLAEHDYIFIDNYVYVKEKNRQEEIIKVGTVFLETETGKLVLLEGEEEIRQYFIDLETIRRDYIYKDYINGELILNNNFNEGDNND